MSAVAAAHVRRLGGRFGAEVTGLPAVDGLTDGDLARLRDLLLEHKVVGLRDQHLGATEQGRLVARLAGAAPYGALRARAWPAAADGPALAHAPSPARWVCDRSWLLAPPAIVCLRAATPDVAGECTPFADAGGAYRDLPGPLRALAERSWAVHQAGRAAPADRGDGPVAHPVVRLHTETGERTLLLGGHARRLVGMTIAESRTVIHLLQSYLVRPHNVQHRTWRPGDLLLVDARAVQRHARSGRGPATATTSWAEVAGDAPLGVDGQHSHALGTTLPGARRSA